MNGKKTAKALEQKGSFWVRFGFETGRASAIQENARDEWARRDRRRRESGTRAAREIVDPNRQEKWRRFDPKWSYPVFVAGYGFGRAGGSWLLS